MSSPVRAALTPLAILTLLVHVGHWRTTWTDDAFITFRYARNFAAGDGMVFNPGTAVEGITNLGWALVLAPFAGGDLLLVSQVGGLLAGVATVVVLAAWARREGLGLAATVACLAGLVLAPWPAFWLVQGLETPIVMLLCTLAWSRHRVEADGARGPLLSGAALGLGPWFRPDAALLAILVGAWHLWTRGIPRGRAASSAGIVAASAAALVGLKLAWYGEVLPNTFHVKVDHFPPDRGLDYLRSFLTVPSPWVATMLLAACAWGVSRALRRDDRALPGILFCAYLVAAVLENGDFFANFRLLVPVWPAACAALGLAIDELGRWAAGRTRGAAGVAASVASVALFASLSRVDAVDRLDARGGPEVVPRKSAPLWAPWRSRRWEGGPRDQMPFPTAWALVNVGPNDVVAYSELGLIGFVQEGPVLDMLGLTDEVIAGRNGESWKDQVDYVEGRAGAMVISTTAGLWTRWRAALATGGWEPVAACDQNWVFRNPKVAVTPPDAAELDRRLALALDRAPRAAGLHLAIARELGAAGNTERAATWLASLDVDEADRDKARCDLGLVEGCSPRPTCERGGVRRTGAELGDATRWPAVDPSMAAPEAPVVGAQSAEAVGPDGKPLAGAPLADEQASAPPTLPEGCGDARGLAASAWEDLGKAWPRLVPFDELRRASREAARAVRAGLPDMGPAAERVATTTPDAQALAPELAPALQDALRLSRQAVERCR